MNIKELREKSMAELDRLLVEERDRLRTLRFKDAASQLKDVRDIREVKKNIARILTLQRSNSAK